MNEYDFNSKINNNTLNNFSRIISPAEELSQSSIFLFGARGVGKSYLLRESFILITVEFSGTENSYNDLYTQV